MQAARYSHIKQRYQPAYALIIQVFVYVYFANCTNSRNKPRQTEDKLCERVFAAVAAAAAAGI